MNETQNRDSWSKIKLFGDYEEVKDIIWSLPKAKQGKYFYAIFTSNLKLKVGVTEHPIKRIKTHEHGLHVYGNARIKKILLTHPTSHYEKLERAAISKMDNLHEKSGAEFFSSGNIFSDLAVLMEIIKGFGFYEITSQGSYLDILFEHVTKYFDLFPQENILKVKLSELKVNGFNNLKNKDISKKVKPLLRLYQELISLNGNEYQIKKGITQIDILAPRLAGSDYF